MKTGSLALALALTIAACGQPNTSKAQDGVFSDNRVVPGDATAVKSSFAPVVRAAAPAVVNIAARGVQQVRDPFFGMPGQRETGSVGSGVIVRPNGVVVTNYHVVNGMSSIRVILNDRREFNARVVLGDERSDLAVLQLEGVNERLPVLNIDDREEQQVGDLVLAIGNPFGVGQTVTNGIISALNRTETNISDSGSFIQTDAAINPGNSGGALVDMDGDLIAAVDGAEINDQGGQNFRVGLHDPNETVEVTLVRDGRRQTLNARIAPLPGDPDTGKATLIQQGGLSGAQAVALNPALADSLGGDPFSAGAIITGVQRGSYANRVGFQAGDVVVAVNGRPVSAPTQLASVGRGAEVTINRRGRTITGTIR